MTFALEQIKELEAPLSKAVVKRNPRGFDYVEGWHAIAEANRVFGFGEWDREAVEMRQLGEPRVVAEKWRVSYFAKVRITVRAGGEVIVREGCGYGSGIDKDVGQSHESALKEAETDAMKRALMTFGNPFGLALYDKDQANVAEAPPAVSAADTAISMLQAFGTSQAHFKEAWEKNKAGWKEVMSDADYRRVVAEMKRIAAAFQAAPAPPVNGAAKPALGLGDDDVPQFH